MGCCAGGNRNLQVQSADASNGGHARETDLSCNEAVTLHLEAGRAVDEASVVVASGNANPVLEGGPHVGGRSHAREPHDGEESVNGNDDEDAPRRLEASNALGGENETKAKPGQDGLERLKLAGQL